MQVKSLRRSVVSSRLLGIALLLLVQGMAGCGDDSRDGGPVGPALDAIRQIKQYPPGVKTLLGVNNISFGLSTAARHALNSVFLHHASEAGLDMAIVHAGKIMPLYKIDEQGGEFCAGSSSSMNGGSRRIARDRHSL